MPKAPILPQKWPKKGPDLLEIATKSKYDNSIVHFLSWRTNLNNGTNI